VNQTAALVSNEQQGEKAANSDGFRRLNEIIHDNIL
jgi:hypothetical protein